MTGAQDHRAADRRTAAGSPRGLGDGERVTRRQAAERLTDLAYSLTAGRPIEMGDGEATGQVPEELMMKRGITETGGRAALQLDLSWPSPEEPEDPRPS